MKYLLLINFVPIKFHVNVYLTKEPHSHQITTIRLN
jgi:hypothetical protein